MPGPGQELTDVEYKLRCAEEEILMLKRDKLNLYEQIKTLKGKINSHKLFIVGAAVDPNHQTEHCDHCGLVFEDDDEKIQTCSHTEYLTLCRPCYNKAGNSVR